MSETLWLVLAIAVGLLAATGWIARERWIQRRRNRVLHQKEVGR